MTTLTKHAGSGRRGEVEAFRSASLSGDAIPERVLLAPWGQVESSHGSFVVDDEAVRLTVEAFEQHGTDLPIDYEHQTLGGAYASPDGKAPAAGWVRRLWSEPGVGLLAQIEWTDQARKVLAAREYRYLSPVAIIRKSDRKLVALHSAALTNKPAIVGMQPIVHREGAVQETAGAELLEQLRTELDLAGDAGAEEVLIAASQRLQALRQADRDWRVHERVEAALRAGKLVEAQRTWAEALVAREADLFDEWFDSAPVIVATGVTRGPGQASAAASRNSLEKRARSEFRAHPFLARLTSEDAYAALALMEA